METETAMPNGMMTAGNGTAIMLKTTSRIATMTKSPGLLLRDI